MSPDLLLYGNDAWTSPYVLSCFVVLEEKGLPYELRLLSLEQKDHHRSGYRDATLTGKVPALQHGDFWLAESSAIDEYLEDAFPPPRYARLYPADPQGRARVRMVQALVRTDFLPLRKERATDTLFCGAPIAPLSPDAQASAEHLLRIAGALVRSPDGFVAAHFSPADVDLSLMLMRLVANGDPVPEVLSAWARRTWERPSIRKWLAHTRFRG